MNANELADMAENACCAYQKEIATMLRQQQSVIEDLEKENTDLRYLIATKLEQQDGISLNSMAHPITNTPEPSYEIDLDKLETIEIDLPSPEPVAWMVESDEDVSFIMCGKGFAKPDESWNKVTPVYTHPVKELSETRIKQIFVEQTGFYFDDNPADDLALMDFAKALLLEAQEK